MLLVCNRPRVYLFCTIFLALMVVVGRKVQFEVWYLRLHFVHLVDQHSAVECLGFKQLKIQLLFFSISLLLSVLSNFKQSISFSFDSSLKVHIPFCRCFLVVDGHFCFVISSCFLSTVIFHLFSWLLRHFFPFLCHRSWFHLSFLQRGFFMQQIFLGFQKFHFIISFFIVILFCQHFSILFQFVCKSI